MSEHFFELIRVALGRKDALSAALSDDEWQQMLQMAVRQTLVGVCFTGVERLPAGQRPPQDLLMLWYGLTRQIEERNRFMNHMTQQVADYFEGAGFEACILKGQCNALLYPSPLRRQSGDVDVWVIPKGADIAHWMENCEAVVRHVYAHCPEACFGHKHIEFPLWEDTVVEIHFYPSYLKNLLAHQRLLHFFSNHGSEQFSHFVHLDGEVKVVATPTVAFSLIFQLVHIFEHFITQGIGLRQVMDYFYLLRRLQEDAKPKIVEELNQLHLYSFASAMMWVLHHVLGLEEHFLLVQPDAQRGLVLLNDIMEGGNFGQFDTQRIRIGIRRSAYYIWKLRRLVRFFQYYPHEVLWDIPFRLYRRMWMLYASVRYSKVLTRTCGRQRTKTPGTTKIIGQR